MGTKYLAEMAQNVTDRKKPKITHRYKLTISYSIKYPTIKTDNDLMGLACMIKKSSGIMSRRRYISWVGSMEECDAAKRKIETYAKKKKMLIKAEYIRVQ